MRESHEIAYKILVIINTVLLILGILNLHKSMVGLVASSGLLARRGHRLRHGYIHFNFSRKPGLKESDQTGLI